MAGGTAAAASSPRPPPPPHRSHRGQYPPLPASHAAETIFLHAEEACPSPTAARAPPHARRYEVGTYRLVACPRPAAAAGRQFRAAVVLKCLSRSSLAVGVSDRRRRRAELQGTVGSPGRILGVA